MRGFEVVKLGGAESEDEIFLARFALSCVGSSHPIVIVHGGGKRISAVCERLGLPVVFESGLRRTPPEVAEIAAWILGGTVNSAVTRVLREKGVDAVSVRGCDGLLQAVPHARAPELGSVGEVSSVDTALLFRFAKANFLPVIAPIGRFANGTLANVNADHAAVSIALALGAESLSFVSSVPGVLREGEVVPELSQAESAKLIAQGIVRDGMVPKVESALRARAGGVPIVRIRGTVPNTSCTVFR